MQTRGYEPAKVCSTAGASVTAASARFVIDPVKLPAVITMVTALVTVMADVTGAPLIVSANVLVRSRVMGEETVAGPVRIKEPLARLVSTNPPENTAGTQNAQPKTERLL